MGEAFPVWEAASRWSQALEEVEERSRPLLEEVQSYETYRYLETCGGGVRGRQRCELLRSPLPLELSN